MTSLPSHLIPSDPQGSESLSIERSRATFDVRELTLAMYTKSELKKCDKVLAVLQNEPLFSKSYIYFMGRKELFKHALRKDKRLVQLIKQHNWDAEEIDIAEIFLDLPGPYGLHRSMFIPTIIGQGTEEQKEKFLVPALKHQIIGCYAQTELGHGSNVQGLETIATYIPATDEFEIHSPYLTASKWWVGGLGRTANHAVVMARLMSNNKDYGPHPFIVQIRDLKTHEPLPGINIGDIGPKFGYNATDNGFILFDHVRIPRINMLSKYSQVVKGTGEYLKPPNDKLSYATMVLIRAAIILSVKLVLARAATIAVRYSAVRRQFVDKDEPRRLKNGKIIETPILDYTMQQYRLFPVIAQAYTCHFTGRAIIDLYQENVKRVSNGDFSLMAYLHASSSGLKSLTTTMAVDSIEDCRRACGGHGYSSFSGFVAFYQDYLPNATWEGDNYILTQQTARYLLKTYRETIRGKNAENSTKYSDAYLSQYLRNPNQKCPVTCPSDFKNPEIQLESYGYRAAFLISRTVDQLDNHNKSWNSMLVEISRISKAHCQYLLVKNFILALNREPSKDDDERQSILNSNENLKSVLRSLCNLFALHTMEKDLGEFLESGYISPDQVIMLRTQVSELLGEIRPNAVALVDAFRLPDFMLNSALGRYDGKVYETMMDLTSKEPLNAVTLDVDPNSEILFRDENHDENYARAKL